MNTKDFYFDLPERLIAQQPAEQRGGDRLLALNRLTGATADYLMEDLPNLIEPGTVMVFNNSRVRRARVYGKTADTGSMIEFLFISPVTETSGDDMFLKEPAAVWKTMVRNAKRQKPGRVYTFLDGTSGEITGGEGEFRVLALDHPIEEQWFEANGHIPLPPYIKRDDDSMDSDRYQTVYARESGSVAAPTAGLHFTDDILSRIRARGIETVWVTLHVGLGTFLPVRTERIEDHTMHEERFSVSAEASSAVARAKKEKRPVLAVGTTSIRTLESAWDDTLQQPRVGSQKTHIFIYPGYQFKAVDQVFTNFHTPESTLVMLVSAFAGKEHILAAYAEAVRKEYRFFSYGDAMLIR